MAVDVRNLWYNILQLLYLKEKENEKRKKDRKSTRLNSSHRL